MRQASRQAMVFFAHGSRDPLWRRPAEAIAERVRQLDPKLLVRCAYLESAEPDLPACVAELAALGVAAIRVVPLFLGVGKHAREDLPRMAQDLQSRFPGISFNLRPAIGDDARFVEMIAQMSLDP